MTRTRTIPISEWGRDHWSMLGFLLSVYVGQNGRLDGKMRRCVRTDGEKYPTRLANDKIEPGHNDWDCMDDIEEAGLVENQGTGANPLIYVTEKGWTIGKKLTEHVFAGQGCFMNFKLQEGKT